MDKQRLYKIAYRKLENVTPLRTDCGQLCDKACCKGDKETGMHLYPGEMEMYNPLPDFLSIRSTELYLGAEKVLLATCKSTCSRNMRPLSCRIFPLVPYLDNNGGSSVIIDPRALHICPLAECWNQGEKVIDSFFIRDVRRVFRLLMQDNDIRNFVKYISRIIDEHIAVVEKFS